MPARPTAMMAVPPYLLRCVDFDRLHLHLFSFRKMFLCIFIAKKSAANLSINVALIWLPGIGGMKRFGRAVNGIAIEEQRFGSLPPEPAFAEASAYARFGATSRRRRSRKMEVDGIY